jgi:riboflavin synthase
LFTGIVETQGKIEKKSEGLRAQRLTVSTTLDLSGLPLGGSIAVDGVCLTAVARRARRPGWIFQADLGPETLSLTTLGERRPGDRVHLERPLRMGDPLGGHLVAGHVDGVGQLRKAVRRGEALELEVAAPAEIASYLAPKGSVAIDGVSLTINRVAGRSFSVTLIPHTLAVTHLGALAVGARVNLEADLLAKQLARLLDQRRPRKTRARSASPARSAGPEWKPASNRRSRRAV